MKKRLSFLVALMLLITSVGSVSATAETTYKEAPMLTALVEAGELPPVSERLPKVVKAPDEILPEFLDLEVGAYGGNMRFITKAVNWDADVFIGQNEALLTMQSANSDQITPNIVESYEVNEEQTEFTFKLREGLKWSDGTPVTMEDIEFTINDYIFNEELTPVVAAYMRDGGISTGNPFTFTKVDDWTFKLSFGAPYGGFIVHLSIAGWKGYTDMLKPAHFLKRFHPAYAEEIYGSEEAFFEAMQPVAEALNYENFKDNWVTIFNQIDMTNWELTDPTDALTALTFKGAIQENFPVLYGWVMKSSDNGVTKWERNPYYHKVDADGQQLPYVDTLTSTLVEDMEMVQLKYMTGEADFGRESATIDNITLYKENEATANIKAYVTPMHVVPTDIMFNMNYADEAYQECVSDIRFRKALAMAVDAEEILDAVYKGFGQVKESFPCTGDVDAANALLDEMGMTVGSDGYRMSPSGKPLAWSIYNASEANDIIPVCELFVEFWSELNLKVDVKTIEPTLLSTMTEANEIPMRCMWVTGAQLWHYLDWGPGMWAPLWNTWWKKAGAAGVEPPQEVKDFFLKTESLMTVSPTEAVNVILPELDQFMADSLFYIEPLYNVEQCVIANADLGNIPTGGAGIGWNFGIEQMFYRSLKG